MDKFLIDVYYFGKRVRFNDVIEAEHSIAALDIVFSEMQDGWCGIRRSMSVGDVVRMFQEIEGQRITTWWKCEDVGWSTIPAPEGIDQQRMLAIA